jgi:hypothetical protein
VAGDSAATARRQQLEEVGGIGGHGRRQDAHRHDPPGVVLLDECGQRLVIRGAGDVLEHEDVARHQLAVTHREQLHGGLGTRSGETEHVLFRGLRSAAIFWLSMVRSMARTLSRMAAARS